MKPLKRRKLFVSMTLGLVYCCAAVSLAVVKSPTGTELTDAASWGGTLPGIAEWNSSSLTGNLTVNSAITWEKFIFANTTPLVINGSPITLTGPTPAAAFDAMAGNATGSRTINNDLILSSPGYTFSPGGSAGRMQFNSGNSGGITLGNLTALGGANAGDANVWIRGSGVNTINGTLTVDGQVAKGDSSTWILNGNNTVGYFYINNGALLAGSNSAFGAGSIYFNDNANNSSPVVASVDSTPRSFVNALEITGGFAGNTRQATFGQITGGTGALTFSGNVNLSTAVRNITTNVDTTFSGNVIGNNGGFIKSGDGTLILASTGNTFTGAVTVNAGKLLVNGNIPGTAALTINGGTLGGTGVISRAVNVNTGATLAPGASIESLSIASVTLASGSSFAWEAASNSATGADLLTITGALSLTDVTLSLDPTTLAALSSNSWSNNDKLTLINYGGTAITSGFAGYSDDTLYSFGSNSWLLNYNDTTGGSNYAGEATAANFVTLTFVAAIPEPGTIVAAMLAVACGLGFRMRRSRAEE